MGWGGIRNGRVGRSEVGWGGVGSGMVEWVGVRWGGVEWDKEW